jgi:hypothetical protein
MSRSPLVAALLLAAALPAWAAPKATRPASGKGPRAAHERARPARADDASAPVREAYRLDQAFVAEADRPDEQRHALAPWEPPHRDRLFTKRLAALLETDARYSSVTGEDGALDGDPLLDAQDFEDDVFKGVRVDVLEQSGDRAEVRARFTLDGPREVLFTVVREQGRWAVDDIRGPSGSLAALLSEPHECAEGWKEPCRKE